MKKRQWIFGFLALAAFVALAVYGQHKYPFDWQKFPGQFIHANLRKIGMALVIIYSCYLIRSVRWARLLRPIKKVGPFSLLSTQVIGFTYVALLGRVMDPVRPYLVAKKTGLPLSSQVAVYIIERLMDMGAMALIFCTVILLAPTGALPHPEIVKKFAYGGLTITALGALFLLAVRMTPELVVLYAERLFGRISSKLRVAAGHKIRTFYTGLDTMRCFSDFASVGALSLLMWGLIVVAYVEIIQAFVPALTLPMCMLLMAWGMAASTLQLPVVGWFSQIIFVAGAMIGFFNVIPETATACAATLLLVSFLGIVPVGLIWAQFEHVNLRKVAAESEQAEGELGVD